MHTRVVRTGRQSIETGILYMHKRVVLTEHGGFKNTAVYCVSHWKGRDDCDTYPLRVW